MTMNSTTSQDTQDDDDWNLPFDFHLFAQHTAYPVYLPNGSRFSVFCVEALTPLDMMSLSCGLHDATGHCVWMGAFLVIACLEDVSCYLNNRVIELGAGTGISGIALIKAGVASFVCMTDADPEALKLCRRNCELNILPSDSFSVETLKWGETASLNRSMAANSFDSVMAADVLYDIGLLPALLQTAGECLVEKGYFILSHVPRACFNSKNPPVKDLESFIVDRASRSGFSLLTIIRPDPERQQSIPSDGLNSISLKEMLDVGAALLVFQKVS